MEGFSNVTFFSVYNLVRVQILFTQIQEVSSSVYPNSYLFEPFTLSVAEVKLNESEVRGRKKFSHNPVFSQNVSAFFILSTDCV